MIAKNESTKFDRQKQIAKQLNLRYGQTECVAPCTLTAPGDPQPDHVRDKKITNILTKAKNSEQKEKQIYQRKTNTLTAPGDPQPDHVRDKKITKATKLCATKK